MSKWKFFQRLDTFLWIISCSNGFIVRNKNTLKLKLNSMDYQERKFSCKKIKFSFTYFYFQIQIKILLPIIFSALYSFSCFIGYFAFSLIKLINYLQKLYYFTLFYCVAIFIEVFLNFSKHCLPSFMLWWRSIVIVTLNLCLLLQFQLFILKKHKKRKKRKN